MSPAIMSALTALASRSKRLRPYVPFLSIIPVALGAYQLYKRHQASAVHG
jgi:hypothetical protein